jgi:beta-glucosidase
MKGRIRIGKMLFLAWWMVMVLDAFAQKSVETAIEATLKKMTVRQKIGQLNQVSARTPDEKLYNMIRNGEIGSILNAEDPLLLDKMQKIAVEESPLKIPIVFARDVIHGYKTIFPIPLGQAATFDQQVVENGARIAAVESAANGIKWTFAPMMDVSRDPRWGRIAESFGEDTYLSAVMGAAMIRGFQGKQLSDATSIAACAKHFVAYGASEGGRDYNVTNVAERQLRNVYLPPFEKAIRDAGCATIMTSFNSNDGIPASGNKYLLKNVLRQEWGFKGVVVSDYNSISNMIVQGFAENRKNAAFKALDAGLDMEMVSSTYLENVEKLIVEKKISISTIDSMVRNVLRLKYTLGLFTKPYRNSNDTSLFYAQKHLDEAKLAAEKSLVLLKNKNNILPLSNQVQTVAIIGPLADAPHDQMGTWVFDGEKSKTITPLNALKEQYGNKVRFLYEKGLSFSRDNDESKFETAIAIAKQSDVVLLFIGEESILTGEAHSLASLNLVGAQSKLLSALKAVGKPIVTIIMAGRPLTIEKELEQTDALLYAWHPGTMGGPAMADIIFGKSYPSGKLPVTFPRRVGQIPIYYAYERIGRPAKKTEMLLNRIPLEAKQSSLGMTSYYLDAGFDPLFPFGYGLSYTSFQIDNLKLQKDTVHIGDSIKVSVDVRNTGSREGCEVVQLYTADVAASIVPLEKELRAFERVTLKPGEKSTVTFAISVSQLQFWNNEMKRVVEPGEYKIMAGSSSQHLVQGKLMVVK